VLSVALAREKKVAAFRAIVIGPTLICTVGILEASSALGILNWKLTLEYLLREDSSITWKFDPDPALGWKRRPHDKWVSPSIADIERDFSMRSARQVQLAFTYDAYGYRNPRTLPQADVVLIGDSYIEGFNANDDEVVARKLEEQLGRPVESMGIVGYGTLQNLIVFDKDAPKLAPKVAVFFFFEGNDLYDDFTIEQMWTYEGKFDVRGQPRARSFVRNFLSYAMRWLDPILPNHAPYWAQITGGPRQGETVLFADYAAVPWSDWIADRWSIAVAAMKKAAALGHQRHIETVFVFLPIKERVYWPYVTLPTNSAMKGWTFWPIREDFAKFCRAENVPCLDLTEPFQKDVAAGNMPYLPTDTHWSARGHTLVAELLAATIRTMRVPAASVN
jgi:hypothetical protein